jgi:hypothetical protein
MVHKWFSVFGEVWLQNVILATSAVIAIWTLRSTAKQERRRATVESVREQMKDTEIIKARAVIRPLRHAPLDFTNLTREGNEGDPVRQAILTLLNSYEFMATGLREGAFDEQTYRRMYAVNAKRDWAFLFPFIQTLQHRVSPTVYREFAMLIKRWEDNPLD